MTAIIATDSRIRLPLEHQLAERLVKHPRFHTVGVHRDLPNPDTVRRQLLGRAVRLTQVMAPAAVHAANAVRDAFGLSQPVELYQSAGRENAAMHLLREPILMEIQGRLLSLLDDGALRAVIGHELGHFIAHGPDAPWARESALATLVVLAENAPPELATLASTLSMARELTADRYGLLAVRDLDAVLRLEMVATTGLPSDTLGGDTAGYLAQCCELVESCLQRGEGAQGVTHPEHGVRAWAAWLFSETDLYRELTGIGPGTRAISEVNALIERALQRPELDGAFQYLEAPPVELHELALAASVLVALADGVVSDEEAEILERTFAGLVPSWRQLLDPQAATRRFEELAPVARAYGPAILRPLFNLLLHVLTADGVAHEQEFARLKEIGTLLGGEDLFADLLRPVLLRMEVERREAAASEPLPVHISDAVQALDAFLAAIARRGGSQTNLRRLLRLLGTTTRGPEALERLRHGIARAQLATDADFSTIGLDDFFALTPIHAAPSLNSTSRPPPDALKRAIARLRDELVSGDGNSPSVRLRDIRSGRSFDLAALNRVSVGQAERCLAMILAGRRTTLLTGIQTGQSKDALTLFRQLRELQREHAARREETGARDLYLGTAFVCGVVEGYVVRAPLLLHPVELMAEGEGGIALAPVADETPTANQALFRLIHHKANLSFADDLADRLDEIAADPTQGAPALIERLRNLGLDIFGEEAALHALDPLAASVYEWKGRRLARESCAVVGLFPQSSSDLLEDYTQLLTELESANANPRELLGCANALLPSALRQHNASATQSDVSNEPVTLVLPADPSQVEAIRLARSAQALVVDGPPGTGKSQVIVNLIADALARGERVAVVSEKRAALDVVANRLANAGFGDLTGVVHDVHDDRKMLYRKIAQRLETPPESTSAPPLQDTDMPASVLRQRIEHLRAGDADEPRLGQLAAYAAGIGEAVPAQIPNLSDLSVAAALALARIVDDCRPWGDLLAPGSPWWRKRRSLAGTTAEQRAGFAQNLATAAQTALAVESLATQQGIAPEKCAACIQDLISTNKALVQIPQADELTSLLLQEPQDPSAALMALRAQFMGERDAWQEDPTPVRLNPPASVETDVLSLLANADHFFAVLTPACARALASANKALPQLDGSNGLATLLIEAPQDRSAALLGLRTEFMSETAAWQEEPAPIRLSAPTDIESDVLALLASQSFFRFFSSSWWLARGRVKRQLPQLWPDALGKPLNASLLRGLHRRLRLARLWKRFDETVNTPPMQTALAGDAKQVFAALEMISRIAEPIRNLRQIKPALVSVGAWRPDDIDAWRTLVSERHQSAKEWSAALERIKPQLPELWPQAIEKPLDAALLCNLHRRLRLSRLWRHVDETANTPALRTALTGDAHQVFAVLERAALIAEPVRILRQAHAALESIGAWRPDDFTLWRKLAVDRAKAAMVFRKHMESIAALSGLFPSLDTRTSATELAQLHARFVTDATRVAELDARLADAATKEPRALRVVAACASDNRTSWHDTVLKAWALTRVERHANALPAPLRSAAVDDDASARLAAALDAQANAAKHHVRLRVDASPLLRAPVPDKGARRTPQQTAREKLQKEAAKQRNLMPLRSFVREFATQGLFDALPVWLLSPETLAVLFPRAPVFDLVVFDEASQCTVANGFPALLRAKRATIAGDDKQMPPSSFFKIARDDTDSGDEESAESIDFLDAESLLTLARQRVPARRLTWHYRCREEELIAFSNHAMYGGSLLTCPSSATPPTPPALRWVAVQDARYEEGRNETEAEKVVDLLHELLGRASPPTVGVVTFNLSQRRAVLDAIDLRRSTDAAFAQRIDAAQTREMLDDRPFVKNIESVQGDERDVIVFSLGHAPVERIHKTRGVQRYVPARFGPVGQRGGERRLNVAVSRARNEAIVVASFHPDQLSVARARNDGPRLFKAYLEFAHHWSMGARNQATGVLDRIRLEGENAASPQASRAALPGHVPLAGQVAEALISHGLPVHMQVGASGFKVDVALEGERNGSTYRIAILCDEGAHEDGAFRRAQRAALLRRRGWRVTHVDSLEWLRDRATVLTRILRLMD